MIVQKLTLRLLLLLWGLAGFTMGAQAQDLQVNDNVFFRSVTNPNQELTFSTLWSLIPSLA